jgi:hypothetical protein
LQRDIRRGFPDPEEFDGAVTEPDLVKRRHKS